MSEINNMAMDLANYLKDMDRDIVFKRSSKKLRNSFGRVFQMYYDTGVLSTVIKTDGELKQDIEDRICREKSEIQATIKDIDHYKDTGNGTNKSCIEENLLYSCTECPYEQICTTSWGVSIK